MLSNAATPPPSKPWQHTTQNIDYDVKEVSKFETDYIGSPVATFSFEQIVLDGQSDSITNINQALEHLCQDFYSTHETDFFNIVHENGSDTDYRTGNFPYFYKKTVQSVFCTDSILSILMEEEWYAGGNTYRDPYCYNYSILTGEPITIDKALGMNTEDTVELITNAIYNFLDDTQDVTNNTTNLNSYLIEETLAEYDITEYNYFIDDTGLFVCFPSYVFEFTYTADGPLILKLT